MPTVEEMNRCCLSSGVVGFDAHHVQIIDKSRADETQGEAEL